jgi:hypothetical protein
MTENNNSEYLLYQLKKEADEIASETTSVNWLAVADRCLISQTEVVAKPDTICYLHHTENPYSLLTRGSISTFTGKAKAGKTTVLALLIASVLNNKRVLWLDTEQGQYYASRTQSYILNIAKLTKCDNLRMFDLRQFNPLDKLKIIDALIKDQLYDLIVLDGVRDVVFDINSPEEATNTISRLMAWSVEFNCHIAMVLHQNKGNNDVRGHLGTEAINKSEIVISVSKTDDNPPSAMVATEYSRGMPFEDFYIKRDITTGIPYVDADYSPVERKASGKRLSSPIDFPLEAHCEVLNIVFQRNEVLTSGAFKSGLIAAWNTVGGDNLSESRARTFLEHYSQRGFIEKKDKQKGNTTIIKLNPKYKNEVELVKTVEFVYQLSNQLTNCVGQ